MTETMYNVPSDPTISKVVITEESVKNGAPPELYHDREKAERPRLEGQFLRGGLNQTPMRDTAS